MTPSHVASLSAAAACSIAASDAARSLAAWSPCCFGDGSASSAAAALVRTLRADLCRLGRARRKGEYHVLRASSGVISMGCGGRCLNMSYAPKPYRSRAHGQAQARRLLAMRPRRSSSSGAERPALTCSGVPHAGTAHDLADLRRVLPH
eukprot:2744457-Prymnesium_polylepis.2